MTSAVAEAAAAMAVVRLQHIAAVPVNTRVLFDHQKPPKDDEWSIWLLLGGRGAGKTEAGARFVDSHANGTPCLQGATPHRIAIVAPSHDDAVNTCVRGETGILAANPRILFRPGAAKMADLTWPNGAEAELFGTFAPEDVERFRGPQHCLVWGDEFAAWRKLDESWDMIQFGLRLGPKGTHRGQPWAPRGTPREAVRDVRRHHAGPPGAGRRAHRGRRRGALDAGAHPL
jgi:phage terminase large subunit-like protein